MSKASDAILNVLRDIHATPDNPVIMFEIGIPLIIEQQMSETDVLNGLYYLEAAKVIELSGTNTLRLVKPLRT